MFRLCIILLFTAASASAQLNSPFDEQSPVLSPDGKELYFTIGNHPLNVTGKRDPGDIWVSQLADGKWQVPDLVKGLVNNGGYNAVLGFSSDGTEMYLYGHYDSKGGAAGSQGISVSRREGAGGVWSKPKNEEIPYFQNKSVATGGCITPDKSVFIFSADTRDSFGNEDIYVSFNRNGEWTEPLNLGPIINSSNQELSPSLSADGNTLYFSTNREPTLGSFDIYLAERQDGTWTNWSLPRNLGSPINSPGRELFYNALNEKIFFTSTHNSDGYGDIHEIKNDPVETIKQADRKPIQKTQEGMIIFGKVINGATGVGIQADLVFQAQTSAATTSSLDGQYKVALNQLDYALRIEAKGFIGFFERLILPDNNPQELEINFKLQPVAVGVSINLRNVLFKQSSAELLPESNDELNMVVEFLMTNPTVQIELAGHTDNSGKASLNLKLSRDRVARVKNYLVEKGIEAGRVKGIGYGETKPLATNKTDEGKKLNRRVEFRILSVK